MNRASKNKLTTRQLIDDNNYQCDPVDDLGPDYLWEYSLHYIYERDVKQFLLLLEQLDVYKAPEVRSLWYMVDHVRRLMYDKSCQKCLTYKLGIIKT